MQDSPPHSIAEIRRLVSRYLDGLLSPEDTMMLDNLLVRFPIYQAELLALQTAREQVREALNTTALDNLDALDNKPGFLNSDAFWQDIAAQLEKDADQDLLAADPEFISAYYDGEISRDDLEPESTGLTAFEAQLYGNDEANRLLGVMGQVSEAVRRFAYRQESACTVDVMQQVMAVLQADFAQDSEDSELETILPGLLSNKQVEMLSAYADQALTPRETIAANRLVESESEAKALLNDFNRLSDGIRAAAERWQSQAPDCLPELRILLKQALQENAKISVPLSARKKTMLRLLPVAAAALLLLLSFPMLPIHPNEMSGPTIALLPTDYRPESSSMPSLSLPGDQAGSPSQPLLEPVSQARSVPLEGNIITDAQEPRSPSSEEYLFNALNEHNNREDVSSMLGE